jgi:hypothetical protein
MATKHIVKDGEYVSSIAAHYGFSNFRSVWNHPNNADLKERRKNPNILFPGDILFIPDRTSDVVPAVTEKRHRYQLTMSPLTLRLVVKDENDEPEANTVIRVTVEGKTTIVNTDANGLLVQTIPPTAHSGGMVLQADGSATKIEIPLKIGFLHPLEELSGIRARLNNLGYSAGTTEDRGGSRLRSAIEEFQCDHGLTPDGECSPSFQEKLKEVHGC